MMTTRRGRLSWPPVMAACHGRPSWTWRPTKRNGARLKRAHSTPHHAQLVTNCLPNIIIISDVSMQNWRRRCLLWMSQHYRGPLSETDRRPVQTIRTDRRPVQTDHRPVRTDHRPVRKRTVGRYELAASNNYATDATTGGRGDNRGWNGNSTAFIHHNITFT